MNFSVSPDTFRTVRSSTHDQGLRTIALVNNMPDGALKATDRQFRRLVAKARGDHQVRLEVYYIPEIVRGDVGLRYCQAHYRPIDELLDGTVDALIVTGCEPRAGRLDEEPFWGTMQKLVDWAKTNTRSAIWSCLAAHAAVLHLDGIQRHRLPRKLSGVFGCAKATDHALLAGTADTIPVPHSRHNDLRESELIARDYRILTRSEAAGVDCFVKRMPSLFVFFQGHPEYDPDTLAREFRRDLDRFLSGTAPVCPSLPQNYFSEAVSAAMRFDGAEDEAGVREKLRALHAEIGACSPSTTWDLSAGRIYANWLHQIDEQDQEHRLNRTAASL